MKKFSFSLEKLLRYQESLLEDEKNRLKALRMEKNEIDRRLEENHTYLNNQIRERARKAAQGITAFELAGYGFTMENTRRHIKELTVEQERMHWEVEKQLGVVLEKTKEVNSLEKLREKKLEEYRYEESKAEAVRIGELVSRKFIDQASEQAV